MSKFKIVFCQRAQFGMVRSINKYWRVAKVGRFWIGLLLMFAVPVVIEDDRRNIQHLTDYEQGPVERGW